MSNHKHLADLLKVCSILPALAIMPAMADVSNHKYGGGETADGGYMLLYQVEKGGHEFDAEKNALTYFGDENGDMKLVSIWSAINTTNADYKTPLVNVIGDEKSTLNLYSDRPGVYNLVSRFGELNIGTADSPLGTVNIEMDTDASEEDTAIYVTGGNGRPHADKQALNIFANNVSIKSNHVAITGNEGRLDLVANESLDIVGNINGYNEVYGGHSDMTLNINQNEGNTAKTTIVGNINAAMGSMVNIGLKGTDSSITGDMLVSADGVKLPGGGINLQFGDEGTITGNITAQDLGMVKITAGDDFEINGKVFATTDGSSIDIQGSDIEIESESGNVMAEDGAVINIGTESAGDIEIASTDAETLWALNGGILNVGSADTKSVEISSVDNDAIYVGKKNSVVNINGKNISISTNTDGWGAVHVANNVITEDYDYADAATLNITGDNIKITAPETGVYQGIGVTAMSQGVVNVEGNTTIRAQNAILARGYAQVNINKSGENTVKMLGDINFNYIEKTSDSPVNATIDVNLVGEESFWKGNTVVSWDDVMPDPEKLVVSNAKITLKDGAVWNATKITDRETATKGLRQIALNDLVINGGTVNIADTERGIFVDRIVANDATFNGGMLNVNETIDITSGTTVFNSAVLGEAGVLNLAEGATLDIGTSTVDLAQLNIDGTVLASVLSDRSYGSLNGAIVAGENGKVQLNVGSVGSYKIFDSQADIDITAGATYDVSQEADGTVVIATKAVEDIAADTGLTTQAAGAIAGLANATDKNLQKISLAAQQVLNSGDVAAVERETKKLNPTDKPVAQATAASVQNQVLSLTSGRMAGGVSVGRAGGDAVSKENGFWMQGLFNKSKLADEFNGYTRGFALGADLLIDNKWTIGGGLAVNDSDVRSNTADIDIDSKTVFLYGQYKPNNWFVNATATYSMSEYTENKNPFGVMSGAAYDVESYGVQAMGGYDFAAGITAEAGLRYLHIAQDAYTDDLGFKVKATDTDFLSGVAGLKYAFAIENDWKVRLRPELRAAMTYDFISDDIVATVAMPGVASYKVDVERLSRMGGEFGIGLTALYRGMEVSLMYDLDLHKDYTSQTGMIKFRGQF